MLITGFAIYGVIFSPAIVWSWNVLTGMPFVSWNTVGFMVLQVLVIAVTIYYATVAVMAEALAESSPKQSLTFRMVRAAGVPPCCCWMAVRGPAPTQ